MQYKRNVLLQLSVLICFIAFLSLTGCGDQPKKLSGKTTTIEVLYVNWACNCADFIETKYSEVDPKYEIKEQDCTFIEPANKNSVIPESYYSNDHFKYNLKLTGQFYQDLGVPDTYKQKTPERPSKGKVFRYDSFELIKKQ